MSTDTEHIGAGWHGWSIGNTKLHIGPLPGRKSIALYHYDCGAVVVLAWFVSVEMARKALAEIDSLTLVT